MPEEPVKKIPLDATRVNIHDAREMAHWCKRIGCSRAQLIIAVHSAGSTVEGVTGFLREAASRSKKPPGPGAAAGEALCVRTPEPERPT